MTTVLTELLGKLGITNIGEALQTLLNEGKVSFVSTTAIGVLGIDPYSRADGTVIFYFSPVFTGRATTDVGFQIASLHEMYHLYRYLNGNFPERPANWETMTQAEKQAFLTVINNADHLAQINDPIYMEALRQAFPGYTDAQYDMLKYAGVGEDIIKTLPEGLQTEIRNFFTAKNIL